MITKKNWNRKNNKGAKVILLKLLLANELKYVSGKTQVLVCNII